MTPELKVSFQGLQLLMDEGIVDKAEVDALVKNVYLPMLKVLDYSLSAEGITLYSHAPVRFQFISTLAHQLKVPYDDATKESLAKSIDLMNDQFQELLNNGQWQALLKEENSPLFHVLWNRFDEVQDTISARPSMVHGYSVTYVHGHDGAYQSQYRHVINMDKLCGQGPRTAEHQLMKMLVKALANPQKKEAAEERIKALREHSIDSDEYRLGAPLKPQPSRWSVLTKVVSKTASLYREGLVKLFEREKVMPSSTKPSPPTKNQWNTSYDQIAKKLKKPSSPPRVPKVPVLDLKLDSPDAPKDLTGHEPPKPAQKSK